MKMHPIFRHAHVGRQVMGLSPQNVSVCEQVGGKLDSSMFWWLGNTQVNLTDLDQFIFCRAYLNHLCVFAVEQLGPYLPFCGLDQAC